MVRLWPLGAAVVLLVILATAVMAPASVSPVDRSEAGLSGFAEAAEGMGYTVRSTALSPRMAEDWDPAKTLFAIVDPTAPYLDAEADLIQDWVQDGGKVLVADGEGASAPIAEKLGVAIRPRHVFDATLGGPDPTKVPANWSGGEAQREILLEAPLVISEGPTGEQAWQILANTTASSFVDLNANGRLDPADSRGPFVVGALSENGRAIVLTSGYPFTNEGIGEAGNGPLTRELVSTLLPDGGTVIIDTSHAAHAGVVDASLRPGHAALALLGGVLGVIAAGTVAVPVLAILWGRSESTHDTEPKGDTPDDLSSGRPAVDVEAIRAGLEPTDTTATSEGPTSQRRRALDEALENVTADGNRRSA